MRVKLVLPALTEATSRHWRSIKYSLFPPLGLATLAGWLNADDDVEIVDEHVEPVTLDDEPELVGIEVYVTSAKRSYRIADAYRRKGAHVVLGGLHATARPHEGARHADTLVVGPGEEAWPRFLRDFRAGKARKVYRSRGRSLAGCPHTRRDLIKGHLYLVPNSAVVSRGCPHACDFCYKERFFAGGRSFYHASLDWALEELSALPGRHLFFLDDNIFADRPFVRGLLGEMRGLGRLWQGASTVEALRDESLVSLAAAAGLRSLFIGFETLNDASLRRHRKPHNHTGEYAAVIRRLHDHGVMINASFVFGLDGDTPDVFDRTVDWALQMGIETATFHILTPYPGTRLHRRMKSEGRLLSDDWDLYDTRHAVFRHPTLTTAALEDGYWRAYERFYAWRSIWAAAATKDTWKQRARHLAYAGAWKKLEPLWNLGIRLQLLPRARPVLERVLAAKGNTRESRRAVARADEHRRRALSSLSSAAAPAADRSADAR